MLIKFIKNRKNTQLLRYFDENWYLSQNDDVRSSGMNAFDHFIRYGWKEKRDPCPLFNVSFYLQLNPDVEEAKINPLLHYISTGWSEGRKPNLLFDVRWYLNNNPDVDKAGVEPLLHYIQNGANEGRSPHPLFDTQWYKLNNPDVTQANVNPLAHFLSSGGKELRNPHPLFNSLWYHQQYSKSDSEIGNPLLDYLMGGADAGRNPNPYFDSLWYVRQHELLRHNGQNPLINYVTLGRHEGRDPHPEFDSEWYLINYPDIKQAKKDPLEHHVLAGQFEGRSTVEPGLSSSMCHVLQIPYEVRKVPNEFTDRNFCIFVTYSRTGEIEDHVLSYFESLRYSGLQMVTVIVTDGLTSKLPDTILESDGLIIRRNHGWDFAAWACALASIPGLWNAKSVIFTNDSIYGPTNPMDLKTIIQSFLNGDDDILGLTDSYENRRHIMSYFIGLKHRALSSEKVRDYWKSINSYRDKDHVIHQYELRTHEVYSSTGLNVRIAFPSKYYPKGTNPTLHHWRDLLSRGFPFVKVQALRDSLPGVDREGWQSVLRKSPTLVNHINAHLSKLAARADETLIPCPIPSPAKRYVIPCNLKNEIGAVSAVRPTEYTDYVLKIPFNFNLELQEIPKRVAVIAHVFYPDLIAELRDEFSKIPTRADLFISTDAEEKKIEIISHLKDYRNGIVTVLVMPNRGRDIAPLLVGFRSVFRDYEYFLHVHSKKSPYGSAHEGWREYLIANLLGTSDNIRSILTTLKTSDVGVIFADHFPGVRNLLNWGYNYDTVKNLLARTGIQLDGTYMLEFPSSSFFWAKTAAVKPLIDLDLQWDDFPEEAGQFDGTIAHAIERSILYFCESTGHRWTKVGVAQHVDHARLIPVHTKEEIASSLVRTHHSLLGNKFRRSSYFDKYGDVVPVIGIKDDCPRYRFNLVIPTIRPEETYGGISTAIKIFQGICQHMGVDVDFRIIVTHSPVDMHCSMQFPDYTVLSPEESGSALRKMIVNMYGLRSSKRLAIRSRDIFMTTAWWTDKFASDVLDIQSSIFGLKQPKVYFIQDFEVGFYPWSTKFALAGSTYVGSDDDIALLNSEELAQFMLPRIKAVNGYVVRYSMNETLRSAIKPAPKERIILFYGRPSAQRNCFELICLAISSWQRRNPELATRWRIVSAGEAYAPAQSQPIVNVEVMGKLSLDDYADLLSRSSVGVSLMISPHPSYPPFEMAAAGLITITNNYENKRMELRSDNVIPLPYLDVDILADAIDEAVGRAESNIGVALSLTPIRDLACDLPNFDGKVVADRIISTAEKRVQEYGH